MNEEGKRLQALPAAEGDLLDYWRIVWKHWWLIAGLVLISSGVTLFVSLRMPKIYTSTITIMATAQGQTGGRGAGLSEALKEGGAGSVLGWLSGPFGGGARDKTMAVLRTNTLAKEIVDKFDLKRTYQVTSDIAAYKTLRQATDMVQSKEGAISITVEDTDPGRAADIANFYPEGLNLVLARFSVANISRQRAFIEERRVETKKALHQAEEALRAFQERNRMVMAPEKQTPEAVSASAGMKSAIMTMEVDLEAMRRYATEQNPEVIVLEKRIQEMKRRLAQLQYGTGMELPTDRSNPGHPQKEIFFPTARFPELGMEYQRHAREVKLQETVYQILTSQLENAKIEEARDVPTIEVIDRAVPAEFKSKPKTRQNVMFAAAIGLFMGVFLAFFLEHVATLRLRRQWREPLGAS